MFKREMFPPVTSYRYPDLFPHTDPLAKIQGKLDDLIREGIHDIIKRLEEPAPDPAPQVPLMQKTSGEDLDAWPRLFKLRFVRLVILFV